MLETLERHEQVGAPLARDHRVDLVDNHGLDPAQGLPRARLRERQLEGLDARHEGMRRRDVLDAVGLDGRMGDELAELQFLYERNYLDVEQLKRENCELILRAEEA